VIGASAQPGGPPASPAMKGGGISFRGWLRTSLATVAAAGSGGPLVAVEADVASPDVHSSLTEVNRQRNFDACHPASDITALKQLCQPLQLLLISPGPPGSPAVHGPPRASAMFPRNLTTLSPYLTPDDTSCRSNGFTCSAAISGKRLVGFPLYPNLGATSRLSWGQGLILALGSKGPPG